MKKLIQFLLLLSISSFLMFAQSDEDLFGSDDDLFGGDGDFFADDGIDVVEEVSAKDNLSKGVVFETGTIKIGGTFDTGVSITTPFYSPRETSISANLSNTTLAPSANAFLTVDARPTQVLRMYTKFGVTYPYTTNASLTMGPSPKVSISDWFSLKELFSDFSIADRAFFRFGLHTVTWGTGYFFSPVSDVINTSSIDPEDVSKQVNGSLNLRTQITFPGSQNCLWIYAIPSTDFTSQISADSYAKETALAAKGDVVIGAYELGFGGFWKYNNAPRAMFTFSGSLFDFSIFGEFVYRYGADIEWTTSNAWDDKTNIVQATIGLSRYWKDESIMFATQYYYDGNEKDPMHQYITYGHNIALMLNFGRVFGTTDVNVALFGMANFGKERIPAVLAPTLEGLGIASYLNALTTSAQISYTPVTDLKLSVGPYLTWNDYDSNPTVALKFTATFGGGKF